MEFALTLNDARRVLTKENLLIAAHNTPWPDLSVKVQTKLDKVARGDIFIAYKGVSFDSHTLIGEAIKRGAACIILEDEAYLAGIDIPCALCHSSRKAWSLLMAQGWGNPHEKLKFVGITGTNGKSSTCWIIKEQLGIMNIPCILIGTGGAWIGDSFEATSFTTPDPDGLFYLLAKAVDQGIKYAVMEVSSHALVLEKLGPLKFNATAFTSFSQDHLDFHSSMSEYLEAKMRLYTHHLAGKGVLSCINVGVMEQIEARGVGGLLNGNLALYGSASEFENGAAIGLTKARNRNKTTIDALGFDGTTITFDRGDSIQSGKIPFLGDFAVSNFAAALILTEFISQKRLASDVWPKIRQVPGRLEPVKVTGSKEHPNIFVDYAHSPDALFKALKTLKQLSQGLLWLVFGCGGDRDKGKRPLMAKVAEELADRIIVTSDNPRNEAPEAILNDIMEGFNDRDSVHVELDRRCAINYAIQGAGKRDTILIAGKGHEDYQIVGTQKIPFDDRLIAKEVLLMR